MWRIQKIQADIEKEIKITHTLHEAGINPMNILA